MAATFIGKCKGCKGCVRIECERSVVGRQVFRCLPNGVRTPSAVLRGTDGRAFERFHQPCLCGRTVEFRQVRGTVTDHKCGAKCLASTSGVCECACGGRNHGAAHAA